MRFTEAAAVTEGVDDDWFDPVLEIDNPLYVDPYLIFKDSGPHWVGAYDEVVSFFEAAMELILASGGSSETVAWQRAVDLLTFPEPHEFALGVALGSPLGAGTGPEFAGRIARVLARVGETNISRLSSISGFALFVDELGRDRISDIMCNILKSRFIAYSKEVFLKHGVATKEVLVRHGSWSAARRRWDTDSTHELFYNPATQGGVLLTPRRFLKDIPRVKPGEFWAWAVNGDGAKLRNELSFDLSESLSRSQKVARARQIAWEDPDLALAYLDVVAAEAHTPYDVEGDPRGLVGWHEIGLQLLSGSQKAAVTLPDPAADFEAWVKAVSGEFRSAVENNEGWRALWEYSTGKRQEEKVVQAVAAMFWRGFCTANDVDLSKEVNGGRGPVDFKFSKGWTRRALVEIKLADSSHFSHGLEKQLPKYMDVEGVDYGIYLVVGYEDAHFEAERKEFVQTTRDAIQAQVGYKIDVMWIDARKPPSASNL